MFADDTQIDVPNKDSANISNWMSTNKVNLNSNRCRGRLFLVSEYLCSSFFIYSSVFHN